MGHPTIHSVLPRSVVAREMVLLIKAVMSAFKTPVEGGHPRGCQRMTWGVAPDPEFLVIP